MFVLPPFYVSGEMITNISSSHLIFKLVKITGTCKTININGELHWGLSLRSSPSDVRKETVRVKTLTFLPI